MRFSDKSPPVPGSEHSECCRFDFTMQRVSGYLLLAAGTMLPGSGDGRPRLSSRNSIGDLE